MKKDFNNKILLAKGETRNTTKKEGDIKCFPIKCHINAECGNVVSWSRPIRAWQDRQGFQKLVERMKKRVR